MTGDVKIVLPRIPRREGEQPFAEQGGDGVANVALVARVGNVVRDGIDNAQPVLGFAKEEDAGIRTGSN
jgi:hypothetical protein